MLIKHANDLNRAHDYANKVDEPAVWSELGHAYLEAGDVPDAIAAYLRSQDGSRFAQARAAPRRLAFAPLPAAPRRASLCARALAALVVRTSQSSHPPHTHTHFPAHTRPAAHRHVQVQRRAL